MQENKPISSATKVTEGDLAKIYDSLGGDLEFRRTFGYVQFARAVIDKHEQWKMFTAVWHPIYSAPRDGTVVFVARLDKYGQVAAGFHAAWDKDSNPLNKTEINSGAWVSGGFAWAEGGPNGPTHWRAYS